MGKLSNTSRRQVPRAGTVLATKSRTAPDTTTHQGGAGYEKDAKTALFTLAVSNFVGEDTFYESAQKRDARFLTLIDQVTKEDPAWVANLLYWLRSEGNMRTGSIVGAVEYGRALSSGADVDRAITPRAVLVSVLQRADEPAEALGYWLGAYGRPVPKWLKRALADAAARLYTPFSALKYDTNSQAIRFGDVIHFSQANRELDLAKWLIDRRYGREDGTYGVEMLAARQELDAMPVAERRTWLDRTPIEDVQARLKGAGYTWEALSGWIQGPLDARVWEAVIPSMGYMALLRNLRNFDESDVPDAVAQKVIARLTDPEQVAKSKQLPFRFLSAYKNVPSDRWKHPLGIALDLSLANVPQLGGKSLILIDTSGSMGGTFSGRGTTQYWEQGALFGLALAKSQATEADIFGFDTSVRAFRLQRGENTLSALKRFERLVTGGGTQTAMAVRQTFRQGVHDRVVVLTDQQAAYDWSLGGYRYNNSARDVVAGGVFSPVPNSVPCYTYDISGYSKGHDLAGTATRRLFAGLNDSAFKMMRILEARHGRGLWPWEIQD